MGRRVRGGRQRRGLREGEGGRGEVRGIDGWEGVRKKLREGREEMERGGGDLFNTCVIKAYTCAQMRDISPVRSHTPNTLHTDHSHDALFTQGNMIGRDTGLIQKCTHLILMVNQCTPIKQELHTPIMPPK